MYVCAQESKTNMKDHVILLFALLTLNFHAALLETSITMLKVEIKSYFDTRMLFISISVAFFYANVHFFFLHWHNLIESIGFVRACAIIAATSFIGNYVCSICQSFWIILVLVTNLYGFAFAGSYQACIFLCTKMYPLAQSVTVSSIFLHLMCAFCALLIGYLDSLYTWQEVFFINAAIVLHLLPLSILVSQSSTFDVTSGGEKAASKSLVVMPPEKDDEEQPKSSLELCRRFPFLFWLLLYAQGANRKAFANFKSYLPFYLQEFYQLSMLQIGRVKCLVFILRTALSICYVFVMRRGAYRSRQMFCVYVAVLVCGFFGNAFSLISQFNLVMLSLICILFALQTSSQGLDAALITHFTSPSKALESYSASFTLASVFILLFGIVNGVLYDFFDTVLTINVFSIFLVTSASINLLYLHFNNFYFE